MTYNKRTNNTKRRRTRLPKTIYNGRVLAVIWFVILTTIIWRCDITYHNVISDIGWCFILVSLILGSYNAYRFTMWIDHRISNSEFGIWARRIISGIMAVGGIALAVMSAFVFGMTATATPYYVVPASIGAMIVGFSMSVFFLSSYMEFTHERKAGVIVSFGRTRY